MISPETIEYRIGKALSARGLTLATAESCTGGLIGHRITNVAGSSAYYLGGIIAYDNRIKAELLGVSEADLVTHGAVSEPVARQMAEGVRTRFGADYAVAVTGIAGPGGGSEDKPVGLVYVAVARGDSAGEHPPFPPFKGGDPNGGDPCWVVRFVFDGTREEIKAATAESALGLLWEWLQ
ncbi:MAG: nicotinamide-nucleotide amidase [Candidatus Hydrogenedentes bacterium]|nr:nicotinamide-nucleotide amidase [Candidatus Hydrogenedentota bacterium]